MMEEESEILIKDPLHYSELGNNLWQLHQGRQLFDVSILSSDGIMLRAHWVVLCAGSEFFRSMMNCINRDAQVILIDVHSDLLGLIIKYLYTGEISVSTNNRLNLAHVAKIKKFHRLAELIEQHSTSSEDNTCQSAASLAEERANVKQSKEKEYSSCQENASKDEDDFMSNYEVGTQRAIVEDTGEVIPGVREEKTVAQDVDTEQIPSQSSLEFKFDKQRSLGEDISFAENLDLDNEEQQRARSDDNEKDRSDLNQGSSVELLNINRKKQISVNLSKNKQLLSDVKQGRRRSSGEDQGRRVSLRNQKKRRTSINFGLAGPIISELKDAKDKEALSTAGSDPCTAVHNNEDLVIKSVSSEYFGRPIAKTDILKRLKFCVEKRLYAKVLRRVKCIKPSIKAVHRLIKWYKCFKMRRSIFSSTGNIQLYWCLKCQLIFKSQLTWTKHFQNFCPLTKKKRKAINERLEPHKFSSRVEKKSKNGDSYKGVSFYSLPSNLGNLEFAHCPDCEEMFSEWSTFRKHLAEEHQYTKEQTTSHISSLFRCLEGCSFQGRNIKSLKNHMAYRHPDVLYSCPECHLHFRVKESLIRHTKLVHRLKDRERYLHACSICRKTFMHIKEKQFHEKIEHGMDYPMQVYSCPMEDCSYQSWSNTQTQNHIATHAVSKLLACSYCDRPYRTKAGLRKHEREVHVSVRVFLCQVCGLSLKSKHSLEMHTRQQHGQEEKFHCQFCIFQTNHRRNLADHVYHKHRVKADYDTRAILHCDQCPDYSTVNASRMRKHMNSTHSEVRNSVCNECPKSFKTDWELRLHKQVHAVSKSFKCPECDFSCKFRGSLDKHIKLQHWFHDYKPYLCVYCNFGSNMMAKIRSHVRRNHRGQEVKVKTDQKVKEQMKIIMLQRKKEEKLEDAEVCKI